VSEKSGREVEYEDIKKGYELGKGSYVMIEPDELQAAKPEATRTIDITDFVDLEEIDPIYYEHTYYLAPATKDKGAVKAYALLLRALDQQDKVGVGTVVMRTKQYLAGIRAKGKALVMSTMLFPDEVVSVDDIPDLPSGCRRCRARVEAGRPGDRRAGRQVGSGPLPRHLPRAGPRAHQEEGRG